MFSLIITIISIGLVAILAIASVYYGGSAFNNGNVKGNAATLVAQAQQISAARTMYFNDMSALPATIGALAPNYLQSIPAAPATVAGAWALDATTGAVSAAVTSDKVCAQVNVTAGVSGATADPSTIPATAPTGVVYSCSGASGSRVMTYAQ